MLMYVKIDGQWVFYSQVNGNTGALTNEDIRTLRNSIDKNALEIDKINKKIDGLSSLFTTRRTSSSYEISFMGKVIASIPIS